MQHDYTILPYLYIVYDACDGCLRFATSIARHIGNKGNAREEGLQDTQIVAEVQVPLSIA